MELKKKSIILIFSMIMMFIVSTIQIGATNNIIVHEKDMYTIAQLFPDENLAKAIAEIVHGNQNTSMLITQDQLLDITSLTIPHMGIRNLSGVENLKNLEFISANGNHIHDISLLSHLPNLMGFIVTEQVVTLPEGEVGIPTLFSLLDNNEMEPVYTITQGQGSYANGELIWYTPGENQLTWMHTSMYGIFSGVLVQDVQAYPNLVMDNDLRVIHGLDETYMWSNDGGSNWTRGAEGTRFIENQTVLVAYYDEEIVAASAWERKAYARNSTVIHRDSLWIVTDYRGADMRDRPGTYSYQVDIDYGKPDGNTGSSYTPTWVRSRWIYVKDIPDAIITFEFSS